VKASFRKAERERPDVIQTLCNGCGPGKLRFIIPDFGPCWQRACFKHDWEYQEGGTLVDMIRADLRFSARLLFCAIDWPWYSWPLMLPLTKIYFLAVFLFGWFNFSWRWKPLTHEEMIELAEKKQKEMIHG